MRKQAGTIIERSGKWYVSYWEKRSVNGTVERKRVTHYLGEKNTRGKYPPAEITEECERYMATMNASAKGVKPQHVLSIVDFVESVYLPWAEYELQPPTVNGYKKIWKTHLKEHFGSTMLREYSTSDATEFLTGLAQKGMGRNAVNHVRSVMSGIFSQAAARGYVSGTPIHLAKVLVTPKAAKETPHYTLLEMASALTALQNEAQARVAMALAFIGLRPSEIKGLRWEDVDLDAGLLHVRRSAWRGSLNEGGKGKNSVRTVTLGALVSNVLDTYHKAHTSQKGFLLENTAGNPLDLDALGRNVIRPILTASGLEWKGYYGGRRGAETEMNRYTNGNSQITSHHFGHTKAVADAHYIKPLPEETRIAALALDSALQETIGRLNTPGQTRVN